MSKIIKIKAMDTTFFRDGKPFNMGEENVADSVFPPMPSVAYGALRTCFLSNNMKYMKILDQEDDLSSQLHIKGIFYGVEGTYDEEAIIYFPLPLDLAQQKDTKEISSLKVRKLDDIIYNQQTECALWSPLNVKQIEKGIINIYNFKRYLRGEIEENSHLERLNDYVTIEPKLGIARDHTRTAKESMLYRMNMIRPNKLVYMVDYEGITLPSNGCLKLGGQARPSQYSHIDCEMNLNKNIFKEGDQYFKLYLLTPGLFSKGWLPGFIDEKTKIFQMGGIKAKLITAAVGKPKYIGGFDLKKRIPKPMYKAVPEGSVYYFKLLEGNMEEVMNLFNFKSICDVGEEYIKQGFSISVVGRVNI